MKTFRYILIGSSVLSTLGFGAIKLNYISNPIIKLVIFISLAASAVGDAVITTQIVRQQNKSGAEQVSASEVIRKALDLACIAMSSDGLYNFRANVFTLCSSDKNKICIKYYSTNMEEAADRKISLERWQGCSGHAWGYNAPVVADLTLPEVNGGAKWGLTHKQVELTKDLGAILSLPVRLPDDEVTIAILSFDTEEPIADLLIKDHHTKIAYEVALQVGLLLVAFNQAKPIS